MVCGRERRQFGAVVVGPWWPRRDAGGPDADPYSVAILARTGEVPLGSGEGIGFTADTDDDGEPLDGRCTYAVSGQTPAARLWTLTAYNSGGRLMANAARRSGFHSREILRRADGTVDITVSRAGAAGNWLPIAPVERFRLVFRLYDTPAIAGSRNAELAMPHIPRAHADETRRCSSSSPA